MYVNKFIWLALVNKTIYMVLRKWMNGIVTQIGLLKFKKLIRRKLLMIWNKKDTKGDISDVKLFEYWKTDKIEN